MENVCIDVCRTCLRTKNTGVLLQENKDLIYKIEVIASIQLLDFTHYPTKICDECADYVNKLYNFRKVLINNDLELKERLNTLRRTSNLQDENIRLFENNEIVKDNILFKNSEKLIDEDIKSEISPERNDHNENFEGLVENNNDDLEDENDLSGRDSEEELSTDNESKNIKNNKSRIRKRNYMTHYVRSCVCKECGLEFTSRFKLYNHRRTVHIIPGICNICGVVVRADNLRRHVALHSEGPAACQHCGKVFKNSESLRGHMLIHKGHVFTCEVCGKMSRVKAEHRRHMKTHTDPEIGKSMCNLCGKKVRDMKKHMHSHTGERPHVCDHCGKGFTSPYALKVHTRQHTNERPYVCPYCNIGYPQKVSLTTHLKSKHPQSDESL